MLPKEYEDNLNRTDIGIYDLLQLRLHNCLGFQGCFYLIIEGKALSWISAVLILNFFHVKSAKDEGILGRRGRRTFATSGKQIVIVVRGPKVAEIEIMFDYSF